MRHNTNRRQSDIRAVQLGQSETAAKSNTSAWDRYAGRHFLVIDNVAEMQRAMGMTLSSFGMDKVEYASRGSDALSRMSRRAFDVILCDYDLGNGYDGLYLLEEIKERNLIKQSCVFMIVTGERRVQRVISAAELAPDDYLLKPFSGELLAFRLNRAIRKRSVFVAVDQAISRSEFLAAIEICTGKIAEQGEFMLDFMKLKGSLCLRISDFETARQLYLSVLDIKKLAWAKLGLAKSLSGLAEHGEAKLLFEEALHYSERIMEAYDGLAQLYCVQGELDEAEALLLKATKLSPMVFRRQKQLAEVALTNGDLRTAQNAALQALELSRPTWHRSPNHYAALARVQLVMDDSNDARKTLSRLRRDFRGDPSGEWMANVIDSQVQTKTGHIAKAEALMHEAEDRYGMIAQTLDTDAQIEFAYACYVQKKNALGDRVIGNLIRNNHDDAVLIWRIGAMFDQLGRGAEGRQMIAGHVRSVTDMNNQAVLEAQKNAFDQAFARFSKAHEELPNNIQVMLNLVNASMAWVHHDGWQKGPMEFAREILMKVQMKAPNNNKFQKLKQSWCLMMTRLGKTDWII